MRFRESGMGVTWVGEVIALDKATKSPTSRLPAVDKGENDGIMNGNLAGIFTQPKNNQKHLLGGTKEMAHLRIVAVGLTLSLIGSFSFPYKADSQTRDFPTHTIRIIIPFPPGGATDLIGRTLADKLQQQFKQPVIADNRPGGAQVIGSREVAQADPDGYTLLLATASHATNPAFISDLPYDSIHDFTPITLLGFSQNVLVVNPSLSVKSVGDLISLAKEKNGQLQYASSGVGSASQLAMELLNSMAGTKMVHVPYKGTGEATVDLLAGRVGIMFTSPVAVIPQAKAGTLRLIATTGKNRMSTIPDVPTVSEEGFPGYDASLWYALLGPRNLPPEIVDKINAAVKIMLQQQDVKDLFGAGGLEPASSSPKELEDFIISEMAKWQGVITKAGIHQ